MVCIFPCREGGQHDQLAIAYQLVLDNRVYSKAASDALPSESISLATSPPKSSPTGLASGLEGGVKESSFSKKQVQSVVVYFWFVLPISSTPTIYNSH